MYALKQAVRDRLIAAAVNGGSAIFDTQAPAGQSYPYVVFQYVAGGDENLTALDTRSELWQVKAVTDNHAAAGTLAAAIRNALHDQSLTVSGWRHLWTRQESHLWLVESAARKAARSPFWICPPHSNIWKCWGCRLSATKRMSSPRSTR